MNANGLVLCINFFRSPTFTLASKELYLFLTIIAIFGFQQSYRVPLTPFDFEDEKNDSTFIKRLSQIESSAGLIYVRDSTSPIIIVIDSQGKFVRTIGKAGPGPTEQGTNSISIGVDGASLWSISGDMKFGHYFENGEHQHSIRLVDYNSFVRLTNAAEPIAFTHDFLILPCMYNTNLFMAYVYDYHAEIRYKIPAVFNKPETVMKNPSINDSFWIRGESAWYCLFKHRPLLQVYDDTFKVQKQFHLEGPEIADLTRELQDFKRVKQFDVPRPYFTDAKIFKGHLYTMCEGALYQIDLTSGVIKKHIVFYSTEPELAGAERLYLFFFAFLEDGTLVLGHPALPWGHNLWKAKLPL